MEDCLRLRERLFAKYSPLNTNSWVGFVKDCNVLTVATVDAIHIFNKVCNLEKSEQLDRGDGPNLNNETTELTELNIEQFGACVHRLAHIVYSKAPYPCMKFCQKHLLMLARLSTNIPIISFREECIVKWRNIRPVSAGLQSMFRNNCKGGSKRVDFDGFRSLVKKCGLFPQYISLVGVQDAFYETLYECTWEDGHCLKRSFLGTLSFGYRELVECLCRVVVKSSLFREGESSDFIVHLLDRFLFPRRYLMYYKSKPIDKSKNRDPATRKNRRRPPYRKSNCEFDEFVVQEKDISQRNKAKHSVIGFFNGDGIPPPSEFGYGSYVDEDSFIRLDDGIFTPSSQRSPKKARGGNNNGVPEGYVAMEEHVAVLTKLRALQDALNVEGMDELDWDGTLHDAEEKMKALVPDMMSDDPKVQTEAQNKFEAYDKIVRNHKDYKERERRLLEEWEDENKDKNQRALQELRDIYPSCIAQGTGLRDLREIFELSPALAKRVFQRKALRLIHMEQGAIARLHIADLTGTYSTQGLDVRELRAVYANLPKEFQADGDGKKAAWRETILKNLKDMIKKAENNTLPKRLVIFPAYLKPIRVPVTPPHSPRSPVLSKYNSAPPRPATSPPRPVSTPLDPHLLLEETMIQSPLPPPPPKSNIAKFAKQCNNNTGSDSAKDEPKSLISELSQVLSMRRRSIS